MSRLHTLSPVIFLVFAWNSHAGSSLELPPKQARMASLIPNRSLAAQFAGDMRGTNEGWPHGVPPSYDWARGPFVEMGNRSTGWKAITAWGAVHEAAEGSRSRNTRVNIRKMQLLLLEKSSHKWIILQRTDAPDGAAYVEDYSGDANRPADIRHEADGTISATAGGGYNFHFYPRSRAPINPDNIAGIVSLFEARLIVADPSRPDDRRLARYLASSGGDYYPELTGGWPGNLDYNPGIAGSKLKYVQTNWRSFAMTTLSEDQLAQNPPPVQLNSTP